MSRGKKICNCPKHGTKYIIKDGASYYCGAPTPGEMFSRCFYHPNVSHPKETKMIMKRRQAEDKSKPNLWKIMEEEWKRHKKNRAVNLQKQRARAKEKRLLAYIN